MHWSKRNALVDEWKEMVFYSAKEAKIPKITKPVEIFITYHHPKKTVDLDNYTPKLILDGLKPFIVDDNIQWIKKLGWEFKTGDKSTTVVIKEVN